MARLGLCLVLGAAFAGAAIWWMWRSRPEPPPPLIEPPAYAEIGVNVALEQYTATELNAVLARLKAAGVRWLRQRFPWDRIEPEPGEFEWATWDRIVAAVAEREMRLIAVLDGSPARCSVPVACLGSLRKK